MICLRRWPALLALLVSGSSLCPVRALAAWGPDSVLTLGSAGSNGAALSRGGFLPASGNDAYAIWYFALDPVASYARVTPDGGRLFGGPFQENIGIPAVAPDGLGGLLDVFLLNFGGIDVSFRRVWWSGFADPPLPTRWWAAQTSIQEFFPVVATDPAGGGYVAWQDVQGKYVVQRVTSGGAIATGWPAIGRPLTPAGGAVQPCPAVLPDGAGGVYVLVQTDRARVFRVQADTTPAPGWPVEGLALESVPSSRSAFEYPMGFSLVNADAGHVFAVWKEGDPQGGNDRLLVQRFGAGGGVDWSELELAPAAGTRIRDVRAQSDGQDGLLVSWDRDGPVEVAHVLADRTVAAGPFVVSTTGHVATVPSRSGGFIVFYDDPTGIRGAWYLGDGSADPSEPIDARLVDPDAAGQVAFPMAARSDGNGGAFLLFDEGGGSSTHAAKMRHVFRAGVLGAGTPSRPSALALSVSPNPARREVVLDFALTGDAPVLVELLDVVGRLVASRTVNGAHGTRRERFELPAGAAPGVYLARVKSGSEVRVQRFAVLN